MINGCCSQRCLTSGTTTVNVLGLDFGLELG